MTASVTGTIVRSTTQADARLLAEYLSTLKPGEAVPYADLSALIGRDIQAEGRPALNAARKQLQNDHRILFEIVHGRGLRRATDRDIVKATGSTLQTLHNAAGRTLDRLRCVNPAALAADDAVRYRTQVAMAGVLHHITDPAKVKPLDDLSRQSAKPLPLSATLAAFRQP